MAYDNERHMTVPARPRGARAAKDRAPAPTGRRRGLRVALTVTIAVCAAAVASVLGYQAGTAQDLVQDYRQAARRARGVMETLFYG